MPQLAFIHTECPLNTSEKQQNRRLVRSHVAKKESLPRERQRKKKKVIHLPRTRPRPIAAATQLPSPATSSEYSDEQMNFGLIGSSSHAHSLIRLEPWRKTSKSYHDGRSRRSKSPFDHVGIVDPSDDYMQVLKTMDILSAPIYRTWTMPLLQYLGVYQWGKLAGEKFAWGSELCVEEDHPLLRTSRMYSVWFVFECLRTNKPGVTTLELQRDTIRLIQAAILDDNLRTSNELILAMLLIACASASQADFKSTQLHKTAAKTCIKLRGGLKTFPPKLQRLIAANMSLLGPDDISAWSPRNFDSPDNIQLPVPMAIDDEGNRHPVEHEILAFLTPGHMIRSSPGHRDFPDSVPFMVHVPLEEGECPCQWGT